MAKLWQHPYVNIFKTFGVGDWQRCSREGDVTAVMDKILKCTVYKISGSVPAGNYIQFPRTSSQSLGLTGNFFYLLFKPTPGKHFVVHLDTVTEDDLIIRISFSNLFREFKSTSTWLQFPFAATATPGSVEDVTSTSNGGKREFGVASSSTRWTLLCLDLHYILSIYLNKIFAYVKSFRLCANMHVKNVFTSNTCYEPGIDIKTARKQGLLANGVIPLPREMNFALKQGELWEAKYEHIKFPVNANKFALLNAFPGKAPSPHGKAGGSPGTIRGPKRVLGVSESMKERPVKPYLAVSTALVNHENTKDRLYGKERVVKFPKNTLPDMTSEGVLNVVEEENAVHVHAHPSKILHVRSKLPKKLVVENTSRKTQKMEKREGMTTLKTSFPQNSQVLMPDPILVMRKIIGFGGGTEDAIWTKDSDYVVYSCYSVVVATEISSGKQDFFIGHTAKVVSLSFNATTTLLASIQAGAEAVLRVWKFATRRCLALRQTHLRDPSSLNFSKGGSRLCVLGIDSHGKQEIIVFDTSQTEKSAKISVVAKAHLDIRACKLTFTPFDESRLVSCGEDNIRFWKVKHGGLRSVAMDLGQYQHGEFTDLSFEVFNRLVEDPTDRKLYVTSKLGNLFIINHKKMAVERVIQLLPFDVRSIVKKRDTKSPDPNIALNSISLTDSFCAIGSSDGFLRLWPLDFSRPFIEAEHEGPVTKISVAPDGTRVLGATSVGTLGLLNIPMKAYLTVMRSHESHVISFALDKIRGHLCTVSKDNSIRVWSLKPISQLYDFRAPGESPTVVVCHPTREQIACGFANGFVRVFDVNSTNLVGEQNYHEGAVLAVAFSTDGTILYSVGSKGLLAMYDSSAEGIPMSRLCKDAVVHDLEATFPVMSLNDAGTRLACIGPCEFIVTVFNARTLDELLRIDITSMAKGSPNSAVDFAVAVCYTPETVGHLLVATSSSRLIKLDCSTGHLLAEVLHVHRGLITAIAVSSNGKYLATAGDRLIKVWDYRMNLDINFQVFIGHSSPITQLMFSSNGSKLYTAGEAIIIWDFYGSRKRKDSGSFEEKMENKESAKKREKPKQQDMVAFHEALNEGDALNYRPRQIVPVPVTYNIAAVDSEKEETSDTPDAEEDSENADLKSVMREMQRRQDNKSIVEGEQMNVVNILEPAPSKSSYHTQPAVYSHHKSRVVSSKLPEKRFIAPPNQAGLQLQSTMGFSGNGRHNVIWNPDTGLFAYSLGSILVIEDLNTSKQRHLRHHVEEISTLAAQHDGQVLASGDSAGSSSEMAQICIWEVSTGLCRMVLEEHKGAVQALRYSRDDRFLLSVGNYQDCTVALWSTRDYSLLVSSFTKYPIHAIEWDPFSFNEFASAGQNGTLSFWLLDETKRQYSLHVYEASVSKDLVVDDTDALFDFTALWFAGSSVLFVGTSQGVVSAWDTRKNSCFMHWEADTCEITVLVARMGKLITGCALGLLRLWSLEGIPDLREPMENVRNDERFSKLVVDDEMKLDGAFTGAVFDDALDMGIVSSEKGTIWYVNWESKTSVRLISGHGLQITALKFFPSHERFFGTTSSDGTLRLWSANSFEQTLQFLVLNQECTCLAFRPCHETLAASYQTGAQTYSPRRTTRTADLKPQQCVAGYGDGTVRMFDLESVEMVLRMKPHNTRVTSVAFSIDGCVILSGGSDGMLAISSPATGITMRVFQSQRGAPITTIHVSNHEHLVHKTISPFLWLAASADRRVSIWSADWSKDVCELVDWMTFPAPNFAPDGTVKSKNAKDWFSHLPPSLALFSPVDPDVIVYTGYGIQKQISFYSLSKKQVTRSISLADWALSIDISPDGSFIAVGCKDRLIKLIDFEEGVFQDFTGHCDSVRHVCFSPKGNKLYSVSFSDVIIWNVSA